MSLGICQSCTTSVEGEGVVDSTGTYHKLCWPGYREHPRATCPECGSTFIPEVESTRQRYPECCFICDFWRVWVERDTGKSPDPDSLRIGGTHYHVGPDSTDRYAFKGHGGAKFTYRRFGEDEIRVTRNLWCQGDIPERFRDRLPDNAEFVQAIS